MNPTPDPGLQDVQTWQEETVPRLKLEADRVCDILGGGAARELPQNPQWQDLERELARLPRNRARIVYYAGVGMRDTSTNVVSLPISDGSREIVPLEKVLAALNVEHQPGRTDRWTVLIMNSCESAYAHVSSQLGNLTVVGAGWGQTSADAARKDDPQSLTLFGEEITTGLSGAADSSHTGNCDGVVTDSELSNYVREAVKNKSKSKLAPVAAVRRSRAIEYPLVSLAGGAQNCVLELPDGGTLPLARRKAFADRLDLRDHLRAGHSALANPPLLAVAAPSEADWLVQALQASGATAGFHLERVNMEDFEEVLALRAATPVTSSVYWVEVRAEISSEWAVHVQGGPTNDSWHVVVPRTGAHVERLSEFLRKLPRRLDVTRSAGRTEGQLEVVDGWPGNDDVGSQGEVDRTHWIGLANGTPEWSRLQVGRLIPTACPKFQGLCFTVPPDLTSQLKPFFLRKRP